MLKRILLFVSCCLISATSGFGQGLEVINEDPYGPIDLIENVFLGEGIEVLNVTYGGDERSVAYFRNGLNSVGLDRGVVMTTGITVPQGAFEGVNGVGNQLLSVNNDSAVPDDPDLRAIVGNMTTPIRDATVYEITFRPLGDSVNFRYVFASEEYPQYVCSNYNDLFGFFISGPGFAGPYSNGAENLAIIPGTDLPVRINTVNGGVVGGSGSSDGCAPPNGSLDNSDLFRANYNTNNQPIFNGLTHVFTAAASVQACETYTIKLIIADINDAVLDSGVFLEARSFGGQSTNLEIVNLSIDGSMSEGCRPAALHFYTTQPVEQDLDLTVDFFGTATPGTDYTQPPATLTIPAGDSLLIVPIAAFEDNFPDPGEDIFISLLRSACFTDTFKIRIEENRLQDLVLDDQFTVCGNETVQLNASVSGQGPEVTTFTSNQEVNLVYSLTNPWRSSFIDVSDVVPDILSEQILESVCILNLEHGRPAQIDAFLFNPNGIPVELTTDNGGNGGGAPFEGYLNTCFTPSATNPITGGGNQAPASMVPFTGEWQPEGTLEDLWFGGNQPTNGQWELRVRDDAFLTNGTLRSWSISFRRPYAIQFAWDQDANLSCYDCPDPELTTQGNDFVNLVVTDTYGCSLTDSVEIVLQPTPPLNFDPTCVAATDSSLLINWGSAPGLTYYEVSTGDGLWENVGLDTFYQFINLASDSSYTFLVRPVFANCAGPELAVSCQTFNCDEDRPVISLESSNDPLCTNATDGSFSVSGSGLYAPFRFFLDGAAQNDPQFDQLGAGTYQAIVQDNRGCRDTTTVTLNEPPPVTNTFVTTGQLGCNTTANITAQPTGGTGNYTFSWNGNPGTNTLSAISNPGTYTVLITDANGCTLMDSTTLSAPDIVSFTNQVSPASCSSVSDGSIELNPTGGSPPYAYAWSVAGVGNTNVVNNLDAGSYAVTISDQTGCEVSETIVVSSGTDPFITGASQVARCFGQSSGSIQLSVQNASLPLSYNWSSPQATGPNPTELPAGVYSLTITDNRGCTSDTLFEVSEPPLLQLADESNGPTCAGLTDGSIVVGATGGTAPYTYNWQHGPNVSSLGSLAAGNYQLNVTDANGCLLTTTFELEEPEPIALSSQVTDNRCADASQGTALVTSPATSSVTYYWPDLNASGPQQNNLPAGNYLVIATNQNGCQSESLVTIGAPAALSADPIVEDVACHGETNGLIELSAQGGTPGYRFRLLNGPQGTEQWSASNVFLGLAPGRYAGEIMDENDCLLNVDGLQIQEPGPLDISLGAPQTIVYGDSIRLQATATGGNLPLLNFNWSATDTSLINCSACPNPVVSPTDQTTVYLTAFDQRGCFARSLLNIIVEKDFPVAVPTGFTPNGDGENDRLVVHGLPGIVVERFQIFDRWGQLLFEQFDFPVNDPSLGWDGTFKGEPLNSDAFIWQARVRYVDGKNQNFHGQTSLIR